MKNLKSTEETKNTLTTLVSARTSFGIPSGPDEMMPKGREREIGAASYHIALAQLLPTSDLTAATTTTVTPNNWLTLK